MGIKDSIALVHSPRGCVYNLRYLLGVRGAKTDRILTTEMDERDVIFGGEARLRKAIKLVDKKYKPNLIAILTSCASSIIGEDIELVTREMQKEVDAKLLPIYSGGFEGDQIDGYKEALKKIVDLILDGKERNSALNLIALYRYGWDVEEIRRMLELMNVKINSILTAKTTLKEIENAYKACLNVVMCEASGFDAAKLMEKRFGIPYISPQLPIGIGATKDFLSEIADFMGSKIPESLLKEERMAKIEIEGVGEKLKKRVCIISGASRIAPLTRFKYEIGMDHVLISIDKPGETTIKNLNSVIEEYNLNPKVLVEPDFDDVLNSIYETKPDLIIGGLYESVLSRKLEIPLCDVMHGEEMTMGFRGAVNLVRKIKGAILSGK